MIKKLFRKKPENEKAKAIPDIDFYTWKDKYDFSREGETAVSSGTSLIDEIRPPSDLPEHILAKLTGDIDKDLEMIKEWKN